MIFLHMGVCVGICTENEFWRRHKMNDRRSRAGPIPVQEGEEYDVEIEGIGEKGDGIAKINGYVVIVPNVQKGDKVKVKVNAVRGKVSFGEVVGEATSDPSASTDEEADEAPAEDAPEEAVEPVQEDAGEETEEASEEEADDEAKDAEEVSEEEKKKEE